MPGITDVLLIAVLVLVVSRVLHQCRKPSGLPGRLGLSGMNDSHSRVTDWGLTHVSIATHDTILDVGCGGGRTIHKLAAIAAGGKVYGIDYSKASVAASRRTNAQWIEAGRVDIQHGSVSRLPFADRTFDLVTAVETHYYWPDLAASFREVLRVLKPGGRLVVIAESYRGRRFDAPFRLIMTLLRAHYLTAPQHRDLFSAAGYADVEIFDDRHKGWICGIGRRPDAEHTTGS